MVGFVIGGKDVDDVVDDDVVLEVEELDVVDEDEVVDGCVVVVVELDEIGRASCRERVYVLV